MFNLKSINSLILLLTFISVSYLDFCEAIHQKSDIPCAVNADCHVNDIRTSDNDVLAKCVDNFCEFTVNGTISGPDSLKTMRVVTKLFAPCRVNEECNIDGAICDDDMCTCSNGTVANFSKRKCIPEAKFIGDVCEEDIQCNFEQVTCRAGKCECEPGYGLKGHDTVDNNDGNKNKTNECRELNGIGSSCKIDTDCEIEHTECNTTEPSAVCACTPGYSAHKKECYAISTTYLSKCDIDYQCQQTLGPDAICIKHICHCKAKHIFSVLKNRCVQPIIREIYNRGCGFGFNQSFYLVPIMLLSLFIYSLRY